LLLLLPCHIAAARVQSNEKNKSKKGKFECKNKQKEKQNKKQTRKMDAGSGSRVGGEVVTVQMGTYANDVGAHYWNLLTTAAATTSARGKVQDRALLVPLRATPPPLR
jgi:hypothetical protein